MQSHNSIPNNFINKIERSAISNQGSHTFFSSKVFVGVDLSHTQIVKYFHLSHTKFSVGVCVGCFGGGVCVGRCVVMIDSIIGLLDYLRRIKEVVEPTD
jgi:hypothetical protein